MAAVCTWPPSVLLNADRALGAPLQGGKGDLEPCMASWPPVGEQWGAGPHLTLLRTQFTIPFLAALPKQTRLDLPSGTA